MSHRLHPFASLLAGLVVLLGACGAELPVSLVKTEADACDYYHAARRNFQALAEAMGGELASSDDPIAVVLRYEAGMAAAAEMLPKDEQASQVPLLLTSSYKEYLFALISAREGYAEIARYYAESFVIVVIA